MDDEKVDESWRGCENQGGHKNKAFCFEATFGWFQLVACAVIVVVAVVAGGGGRGGAAAECVCTYHTIYCSCTYIIYIYIFLYTYIFVYIRLYLTIMYVQSSRWRKMCKLVAPLHSMFSSPGHWYLWKAQSCQKFNANPSFFWGRGNGQTMWVVCPYKVHLFWKVLGSTESRWRWWRETMIR